jgi:hypothetical protein
MYNNMCVVVNVVLYGTLILFIGQLLLLARTLAHFHFLTKCHIKSKCLIIIINRHSDEQINFMTSLVFN